MNDRLKNALLALRNLDTSLKPVQLADQRETALVEGLHGLAEEYGRKLCYTRIDAHGEMNFNIVGADGEGANRANGRYGEELAEWLSQVPRRTGVNSTNAPVLPENGWCRINHFDVERLLNLVAAKMLDNEPDEPTAGFGPR
jgi:hypothetical protein